MWRAGRLVIGGITPLTTIDFPGRLAAVVFCQGCPWRCGYCHNPHLRSFQASCGMSWEVTRDFLAARVGFLDGVVFSGGEPTSQPALADAVKEAKAMGYAVGLHTAGIHPERLERLLPDLEWVGLDVKAPLDARYDKVTGRRGSAAPVRRSLELLLASGIRLQIRTTVDPALLGERELDDLSRTLRGLGAPETTRQPLNPRVSIRRGG